MIIIWCDIFYFYFINNFKNNILFLLSFFLFLFLFLFLSLSLSLSLSWLSCIHIYIYICILYILRFYFFFFLGLNISFGFLPSLSIAFLSAPCFFKSFTIFLFLCSYAHHNGPRPSPERI